MFDPLTGHIPVNDVKYNVVNDVITYYFVPVKHMSCLVSTDREILR